MLSMTSEVLTLGSLRGSGRRKGAVAFARVWIDGFAVLKRNRGARVRDERMLRREVEDMTADMMKVELEGTGVKAF